MTQTSRTPAAGNAADHDWTVMAGGRLVTWEDVSYRLNAALEWHQDGADEDAWDVINDLREELDRDLRDEPRAA